MILVSILLQNLISRKFDWHTKSSNFHIIILSVLHECCHAAAWIKSGVRDGHGPFWRAWAQKAMKAFPELPVIDRCHSYAIRTKFNYVCQNCGLVLGRHSKSVKVDTQKCKMCGGTFKLLEDESKGASKTPNKFALFVKDHYKDTREPGMTHAQAMQELSKKFNKDQ